MSINKFRVTRRAVWYVLRLLLIITAVIVLCLTAFVTAMHASSIYVIVTEGLELRADYILTSSDFNVLTEYFTEDFIAKDRALYSGEYQHFSVANYLYKLEVKGISILPGSESATMRVYEKMLSVTGSLKADGPLGLEMPQWTPAIYDVELSNIDGRWYIKDMIIIETAPVEAPLPTPDYSLLPPSEE